MQILPKVTHRSRRLVVAAVAVGVTMAGATVAGPASATTSTPASFACGSTPATDYHSGGHFDANAVNIRTGSSTSCTSKGLGYEGDQLTLHCIDYSDDWWYLTDNTTGVTGWTAPYVAWDSYVSSC